MRDQPNLCVSLVQDEQHTHVLLFDLARSALVMEVSQYSLHLTLDLRLTLLTVEKRVRQLVNALEFIESRHWRISDLTDERLIEFRDSELQRVLSRRSSRGSEMTARRTVNDKLQTVLLWLKWLRSEGIATCDGVSLPSVDPLTSGRGGRFQSRQSAQVAVRSPVLFRRTGSASKHKVPFAATERTLLAVQQKFFARAKDPYIAHRNGLMVEIASATGFRRGSINSLTTDQFDRDRLAKEQAEVTLIRPSIQKFGYSNEFHFPTWLALRVCDFIDQYRTPMLQKKRFSESSTKQRVFISVKSGRPLTDRAISAAVADAMRQAGAPKGTAIHAFRAKFANDQIEREIEGRLARGMDTSAASIAAAVAMRMGQRNSDSLYAYVSAVQSRKAFEQPVDRSAEVEQLRMEVDQLLADNQFLRLAAEARGRSGT